MAVQGPSPGALVDYHVDPELLVETLAALQSELLSLSMQQQKQLQEAVESHRTELMASVRLNGSMPTEKDYQHTSRDSYEMNGSEGDVEAFQNHVHPAEGPDVTFGNLQPHPCLQLDELENDPYPQIGITPAAATPSIGSPAIAAKATATDDSPKERRGSNESPSSRNLGLGSRSTSRIRNTVTGQDETSAAASSLKLAQERRNGFDTVVGVAVLMNALVMVIDLESQGNNAGVTIGVVDRSIWESSAPVIMVLEHLFVAIFILELVWRIYSERLRYFRELMNVFDSLLVLISCIDLYILTPLIQTSLNNTATLRLLRTIKLVRAVRIVRALRLFRGLRLLVQACSSFLPSLCWSMALLGIFMMMGALLMGNLLQDFILDEEQDFEIRQWIWLHYGTAYRAIYTMYEMTFAGNWPVYARPVLENAGHGYVIFYMIYITFVVFAVIRVISAIFLRETLEAANNDAEILVQERLRKKATYVRKLESIFRACDESGDGVLTEDELNELMQDIRVQVYLESLEIDVHESTALFRLLQNGDGEITCDDFIDGILRCKGPARAIDQILLASDVKNLTNGMQQLFIALAEANVIKPSPKNMGILARRNGSRLQDELALLPSVQMTLSGRYVMS
ncbi:Scn10a [Symbiodinium microadriaticum]|nr:Scn10a [Symbiodinium sp. KB8]CAE7461898.1 Scn10a [Symbiodinium microadriaticum]